jgi:2-methylcitrate dehydratase PrpD
MTHSNKPAPLTDALVAFVSGFDSAKLPSEVRDRTRQVVRDGTGALLAAGNPEFSTFNRIAGLVDDLGGEPVATVVGRSFRTNCVNAALANGTMGYACDFEPHHPEGILHPIAVMIPTALAVGEHVGASGRQFLDAVTIGCEVEYRLSMALGPREQYDLGFHPSAVCGCFGAAACATYLTGVKADSILRAFGLAACQASGMMAWESDPTENARPFQMGMAARNGVTAALLAGRGFGGPTAVFDHGHTVFHAFSRAPQPDRLVDRLGETYDGIMELAIKPYSSVSFLHPGLDALLGLVREEDLAPDDVESIIMHFPRSGVHCVDGNPLKSHCAQYILPVAVANRRVEPADIFFDRRLTDPRIAALSERVSVVADDGELEDLFPNFYATIIELKTRSGQTFTRRNDIARGYPEAWMSESEMVAKFDTLASSVASSERVAALHECLANLDGAPDLTAFAKLLGRPAGM